MFLIYSSYVVLIFFPLGKFLVGYLGELFLFHCVYCFHAIKSPYSWNSQARNFPLLVFNV